MKEFLKKYLSGEELTKLEEDYKKANPDAQGLPVFVGKKRLDEEIDKKKAIQTELETAKKENEDLKKSNQSAIEEAVKKAKAEAEEASKKALEEQKKVYEADNYILKEKGKNVKAIKALIDPDKKLEDEIARLKKDESYLFDLPGDDDDLPGGTGKKGGRKADEKTKELEAMRKAVGIAK